MAAGPGDAAAAGHSPRHLVVAHVAKAHGTRGELYITPLTDHPDTVFAPGRTLRLGDTQGALPDGAPSLVITGARPFKRGYLLAVEGVASRDGADAFARRYLLAPVEDLPPRAEGELFYHELLGLEVVTVEGEAVGRVTEVFEAVPYDLLDVRDAGGRSRLVPFSEAIVKDADVAAGRIVIDPPEGLLDL